MDKTQEIERLKKVVKYFRRLYLVLKKHFKDKTNLAPPRCNAFRMAGPQFLKKGDECAIVWDENYHCYYVHFKIEPNMDFLHKLITEVAESSVCSCQSPLILSDYSIGTMNEGKYAFEGIYRCSKCTNGKPIGLNKMGELFKSIGKFSNVNLSHK